MGPQDVAVPCVPGYGAARAATALTSAQGRAITLLPAGGDAVPEVESELPFSNSLEVRDKTNLVSLHYLSHCINAPVADRFAVIDHIEDDVSPNGTI